MARKPSDRMPKITKNGQNCESARNATSKIHPSGTVTGRVARWLPAGVLPSLFYPFFPFFVHQFFGPIYRSGHLEGCKVAVVLLVQMGFYLFLTRFFSLLDPFCSLFLDPNKGLVTLRVAG